MAQGGATDQEIINTVIAWRRKHGEDLGKLHRYDYWYGGENRDGIVQKARASAHRPEPNATDAQGGGDEDAPKAAPTTEAPPAAQEDPTPAASVGSAAPPPPPPVGGASRDGADKPPESENASDAEQAARAAKAKYEAEKAKYQADEAAEKARQRKRHAEEAEARARTQARFNAAAAKGDADGIAAGRKELLDIASQKLGLRIERAIQLLSTPPEYQMVINGKEIPLGNSLKFTDQKYVRAAINDALKMHSAKLNPNDWDVVHDLLIDAAEQVAAPPEQTDKGRAHAWLTGFLTENAVVDSLAAA